jgi:tRNA-Thr(GGU) m(6)t(6)A37 methyltransferase TsaA
MTDVVRLKARAAVRRRYEQRDDLKGMSPMKARKKNLRTSIAAKEVLPAQLRPIGVIRSRLKERSKAPKQGSEGAPDAWLEVCPFAAQGLNGLAVGDDVIILTWLHRAHRDVLKVHPRSDPGRPLTGVFATRSPDRPNPIGLHRVTVRKIASNRLRVGPIEAIDGTPVIDIKPILCEIQGG